MLMGSGTNAPVYIVDSPLARGTGLVSSLGKSISSLHLVVFYVHVCAVVDFNVDFIVDFIASG